MKALRPLILLLFLGFSAAAQPDTLSTQSQLQDNAYQAPDFLQGVGAGNHGWSRDWWRAKQRIDSLIDAGIASGGIQPSDTAAMLAAYALLSELPADQTLAFNTGTNVLSISGGNGVDLSTLSGGSSESRCFVVLSNADTLQASNAGCTFFMASGSAGDTVRIKLDDTAPIDSTFWYIVNQGANEATLIPGVGNSVNGEDNRVLTIPAYGWFVLNKRDENEYVAGGQYTDAQ